MLELGNGEPKKVFHPWVETVGYGEGRGIVGPDHPGHHPQACLLPWQPMAGGGGHMRGIFLFPYV